MLWPISRAALAFAEEMIRREKAPPDPEDVVLLRRLARALDVDAQRAQLIALRVLTKCIRDGSVSCSDLSELREGPLSEPEVSPGCTSILF